MNFSLAQKKINMEFGADLIWRFEAISAICAKWAKISPNKVYI